MEGIKWGLYDLYLGKYVEVIDRLDEADSIVDVNRALGIPLEERPICEEDYPILKKQLEKELINNLPRGILN